MKRRLHLWLTAVWCGAAVMGFELAGARLLMPVFGMGIEVWAAVIATTLVGLALGYWLGGVVADARPRESVLAFILLLAGFWIETSRFFTRLLAQAIEDLSFIVAVWCSAAGFLLLPLLLLGMVQPFLARLVIGATDRTGRVVGGLLAASTIGGVAGTAITGLVLIPRLGVSTTLTVLAVGTVAMAALLFVTAWRFGGAASSLLIGAAIIYRMEPPAGREVALAPMRVVARVEGLYGDLEVLEHHDSVSLLCNGIFQTTVPHSGLGITKGTLIRGRDYMELIPYFRPAARTALLIGLGGGMHEVALALYGIETHCVELDPAVVRLAAEHFGLWSEVTIADGRAFLNRGARRFDAIILDTFLGGVMPEHLYTKEAFAQAARRLSRDGILAIHLIAHPQHPAARAVARTLSAVFEHITTARSGIGEELQHLYLFASHAPLGLHGRVELDRYGFLGQELCEVDTNDAPILTDDRTSLALLTRDIVRQCRRRSRAERRNPSW